MKKIFLAAISIFMLASLHAQPTAKIVRNSWAGGICCATGVEFAFSIQFPQGTFTCFDSLQVDFDGLKYLFSDMDLVRSNNADLSVGFNVSFGYSSDNKVYDMEGISYYHGLVGGQIETIAQASPRFILVRRGGQEIIIDVAVEETITAYP